ncbi:MAG: HGGxSTG domain-containing protein [Rhodospirillaceae bacterium]
MSDRTAGADTGSGTQRGDAARLRAAPRCGARTRRGAPCRSPAVRGRARCRMHGGAAGAGGQPGNRNAHKDGFHAAAARAGRRAMNGFIAEMTAAVARLEAGETGETGKAGETG